MAQWILGISALYHDAAVALLRDGVVVAAAQEERFTRLKQDASLPVRATAWALAQAGITMADVDFLVFYEKPLRKFERILGTAVATFPRSWRTFPRHMESWLGRKLWLRTELVQTFGIAEDKVLFSEHHLSHAASAFFPSPHEEAAVLVVDGVGEWATTSLWHGRGNALKPIAEVRFPHSIGLLFSALTAHLGFAVNEGEYKVMGMAAWGKPRYRAQMDKLARLEPGGAFSLDLDYFSWHWHPSRSFTPKLVELLGPPRLPGAPFTPEDPGPAGQESRRHADLAASVQAWLQDALLHLAAGAAERVPSKNLCFAGGVALNAVANHHLAARGPFERLWVQPAAGDAGGALGAALWAWHEVLGQPRGAPLKRIDLGAEPESPREMLDDLHFPYEELPDDAALVARAAEDLAAGRVLGWCQGRAELGPRALGHRSILADPRGPEVAERVNTRVKYREPFRPFAPAVTAEAAQSWFDVHPALEEPCRWMLAAVPARAETAARAPGIVHVDGSSRVQVVRREESPLFHALIETFGRQTGVPILLNTSFNIKGEPMVNSAVDAIATFARCELDALYIGRFRVSRPR